MKVKLWISQNCSKWWFGLGIILKLLIIVVLGLLGFSVSYPNHLENAWVAIGAIGQWFGAVVIPFVVIFVQHNLNKKVNKDNRDFGSKLLRLLIE